MDKPEIRRHIVAHFHTIILRRMLKENRGFYVQAREYCGDDMDARKYYVQVCLELQSKIKLFDLIASGLLVLLIVFSVPLIDESVRASTGRLRLARSLRASRTQSG